MSEEDVTILKQTFRIVLYPLRRPKQAGAELGQAQVKLELVDEVLVEVVALVVVEVGVHYFFGRVGVLDEIKTILNSS